MEENSIFVSGKENTLLKNIADDLLEQFYSCLKHPGSKTFALQTVSQQDINLIAHLLMNMPCQRLRYNRCRCLHSLS